MAVCKCPVSSTTTYRFDYIEYPNIKERQQALKSIQDDEEVVAGYASNNLKVNNKILTSKVWPNILNHAEEYKNFLKRLECCKRTNDVYRKHFQCPPVQMGVIDDMFEHLGKTVYQMAYSPNEFVPRKDKMRIAKRTDTIFKTKYHETVYRVSYNPIADLENYNEWIPKREIKKDKMDEIRKSSKKLCTCGKTTYQETLSLPGKLYAKPTPVGPIDRYTLRKV